MRKNSWANYHLEITAPLSASLRYADSELNVKIRLHFGGTNLSSKKKKKTKIVSNKEYHDIYIGRGSAWGNPYEIGKDGTQEEVLEKFRKWFYKRLQKPRYSKAAKKLRGKVLGCTCKPIENCHGYVIVDYLDKE